MSKLVNINNIKGLITELAFELDQTMFEALSGTEFSGIRPADGKVFMTISRQTYSLSQYARLRGVSRQSVHKSVGRLVDLGVVQLASAPTTKRDKVAVITGKGERLQQKLASIFEQMEQDMIADIGDEKFQLLKQILIEAKTKRMERI